MMKPAFRPNRLVGLAAVTLCLAPMTSNEATAQISLRIGSPYSSFGSYSSFRTYSPYGGGFGSGFYGGPAYGYTGYGRGLYGYRVPGGYLYPPANAYGYGVYYRGGFSPPLRTYGRTYYRSGPRNFSPYGYGWR